MTTATWSHPWADLEVDPDGGSTPLVEVPAAPSDPSAVRRMFAQYPAGIAAICAVVEGSPHGMVVTSFTVGASFDPPLALFSAQRDSRTWTTLAAAPRLGISVLADENAHAVRRLSAPHVDRFAEVEIARSRAGAAFVLGARLWLECEILSTQELGDHTLVVLEVVGGSSIAGAAPLVYHDGEIVVAGRT